MTAECPACDGRGDERCPHPNCVSGKLTNLCPDCYGTGQAHNSMGERMAWPCRTCRSARDGFQAQRAICRAAGWEFCETHKRPLRSNGCLHLHGGPEAHEYWCEFPARDCVCPP